MIKLTVLQKRTGPVLGRHPWIFSGALRGAPEGLESGTPVELIDESDNYLASGFFNSYSQIAVRLWGFEQGEQVDASFFERRVARAYALRKAYVAAKGTDSYRVVNGENDLLPGLIVDKYADCLSVQFHNPGIARWKEEIISALKKIVKPKGIYERSDVRDRKREATTPNTPEDSGKRLLYGKIPERVIITENGYKFYVDIMGGQKTGFFLDQRDKRQALTKYVDGKSVVNCFSYTGGFSVYALGAGAKKVVSVDASESALLLAEENMKLNKLSAKKCEFILADVKQYLGDQEKGAFDVIILDPPAFVKDRRKVEEGLRGYKKINTEALHILPESGILVTASCSAHVNLESFRYMLSASALQARRTVQILETYTHGTDHPELVSFTEGEYLKCIFTTII